MTGAAPLCRLGFGVTGPHASLFASRTATTRLVRKAIEHSITLFDTGPAYGAGRAEKRLGDALRGIPRDKVFLSTKAGIGSDRQRDFSPGGIEMSLKASLLRLGTTHVDLLLLHGPAPEELTPKLLRHLDAFRERGLFHHLGICGRGAELACAADIDAIDTVMAPLNPSLSTEALNRLERLKAAGVRIIGIEVMKGAAASARLPLSPASAWYSARHVKHMLTGQLAQRGDRSPREALSWALDHPLADSVVSLTTKPAHLEENARLAGLEPTGLRA